MAKDPAEMTHRERMEALVREMNSPSCVATADKFLELIGHEWRDVSAMRDSAARRHGDNTPAPVVAFASNGANAAPFVNKVEARTPGVGTVADLVSRYLNHPASPYPSLRYKTREHYDLLLKKILSDCADIKLADLDETAIRGLYSRWTNGGKEKLSVAHAYITMFRVMSNFLRKHDDAEADRLAVTLHRVHFWVARARNEGLTLEQANAIREKLRDMGFPSMALAQAFQFDLALRQKDVIGEWVPVTELDKSDVVDGDQKWLRGLLWEEIDSSFILKHASIDNRGAKGIIEVDLKKHPAVMEELQREIDRKGRRESGPLIVCENDGLPWRSPDFRKRWRRAADVCGVPKSVKNMDNRGNVDTEQARLRRPRPALRIVGKSK